MKFQTTLYLAVAFLTVGSLYAIGHPEVGSTESVPEISIAALRGPTGIGLAPYLGGDPVSGEFGTYRFETVPDPSVMVARLASGEASIGMLPSNVAAQLYNRGVPVQIAAVTLWGLLYVVGPEGTVTEWADLEGSTVQSIARGATPDLVMRHLLTQNGLDPERDLTLTYQFAPAELAQLVALGQEDLAVLPEPFVTQVLSRRDDLAVLLDVQEGWTALYGTSYPQTAIVVRTDAAAEHPAAIAEALALISAGWSTVIADPIAAGELVATSDLGMPAAVVSAALPRFNARYVAACDAESALSQFFGILHAFDPRSVGGSIPDAGILYREGCVE